MVEREQIKQQDEPVRRDTPVRSPSSRTPIRRRMEVGAADDRAEREADSIAEVVMRRLGDAGSTRLAQRSTSGGHDGTPSIGADGGELDAGTDRAVRSARGGGQAMDGATRGRMEGAFGADFGRIRIHTDARADRLSRDISAEAFTTGRDVFFRSGVYRPGSAGGDRVLAHELAHTVQQGAASATKVRRSTAQPVTIQRLFGNNRKKRIKKNAYPKIEAVVAKAQQGAATTAELIEAQVAVRRHLATASKMQDSDDALSTLRYLADELSFGIDRLSANASKQQAMGVYANDARSGGMKALSQNSGMYFADNWQHPKAGKDAGLSSAEMAAITTYTADDYKYINPAAANSMGWLTSQMGKPMQRGNEKERMQEGALHTGVIMEAFAKLPVWQGAGFRGERLTPEQFAAQFTDDGTNVTAKQPDQTKSAFWSISIQESVSQTFANGLGSASDQHTVSVMYYIDVTNARDVQQFSAMKHEKEVLAPAGSKFRISRVEKVDNGPVGAPAATAWYKVHMTQTK